MKKLLGIILLAIAMTSNAAIKNKVSIQHDADGDEYLLVVNVNDVVIYSTKPQIRLIHNNKEFMKETTVVDAARFNQIKQSIRK